MARGSIRKRGANRWQLTYDAPRGPDGRRRQRYETVHGTKKQAQARMTEIEHALNQGQYFESIRLTVAEYLDLWIRDYAGVSVRPRTLQGYRSIIDGRLKTAFGSMQIGLLNECWH